MAPLSTDPPDIEHSKWTFKVKRPKEYRSSAGNRVMAIGEDLFRVLSEWMMGLRLQPAGLAWFWKYSIKLTLAALRGR